VSEARVVNARPLILFSRIARLDLIERLAPNILVPNGVIEAVRAGEQKDRAAWHGERLSTAGGAAIDHL
jgi:hypothetical protein